MIVAQTRMVLAEVSGEVGCMSQVEQGGFIVDGMRKMKESEGLKIKFRGLKTTFTEFGNLIYRTGLGRDRF